MSGSRPPDGVFMSINVLGVSGSLRAGSYSTRVLGLVLDAAAAHGASTHLLDLGEADLPLYRPGSFPQSTGYRRTVDAVHWADAFILATPDYHGSMSGAMKNFLDYFWGEFTGKLFGYVCASHEKGLTAMDQMRTVVRQCYGWSLPYGVGVNGDDELGDAGELAQPQVARRLQMLGRDVTVYGRLLREQFNRDLASELDETFAAKYRRHK